MGRFLAGVASALLLAAAGIAWWSGGRGADGPLIPAAPARAAAPAYEAVTEPPQASEKTREERRFARYDKDKDGRVSRDEYLAQRRKAFAKLDTNGDGRLSFEEYAAATGAKFAKADGDGSGALDAGEFATTRVARKARPKPPCQPTAPAIPRDEEQEEG